MKIRILTLLLLCATLTAPAQTETAPEATDAHLFGHVIDSRTRQHLPYVTIALVGTTLGTTTDASGHYLLKNLPFGDYTVEVRALGYAPQRRRVSFRRGKTVELDFEVSEAAVTMDQVVVSASRSERLKREAPSLVSVLDADLFEQAGAQTLAGGLTFQPGVRVENTCQNCGFPQVRINGLDGRYSQVLIDSHPLFSALTSVYGLEQIPANMIERVEVLRGGGSALYGASAIGGTINVITKEPDRSMAEMSHTITSIGCSDAFDHTPTRNASSTALRPMTRSSESDVNFATRRRAARRGSERWRFSACLLALNALWYTRSSALGVGPLPLSLLRCLPPDPLVGPFLLTMRPILSAPRAKNSAIRARNGADCAYRV